MAISSEPPRIHEQQPRPDPLPVDSYVMSYAAPRSTNQAAVLSVIFGLLFFIPLAVPGVAAIVFGRRGVKAAEQDAAGRRGLARLGILLGVLNLFLSLAAAVVLPVQLRIGGQQSLDVQCLSNMRQLGIGLMIYANANKGFLPPTLDELAAPGLVPATVFACPACGANPAKPPVFVGVKVSSHYHYLRPAAKLTQVRGNPSRVVLLYEPVTNHDGRGVNLLFADGHAERMPVSPATTQVVAELVAGQNPPPSKK